MNINIENNQDHRYSRQSYSIGQDVQTKLSESSILVIGYNTVSQEIIRNLALIGIAKIDIFLNSKILNENICSTGLYYKLIDNKIPLEDLRKLNPTIEINYVNILDENNELDIKKIINKYNLLILTNSIIDDAININQITHKLNIPFIMCGTYGLMGYIFNDFGDNFSINDIDGEISDPLILESIDGKLIKFKDEHKLSQDDIIIVTNSDGLETEYKIYRKKTPLIIELKNNISQNKNDYCKIIRKKNSQTFNFEPLKKNINNITSIINDWSFDTNRNNLLHKLHISLDKYYIDFGEIPKSWSITDWEIFQDKYLNKIDFNTESDIMLAKKFCFTLRGEVLPFCSIIGGIVSHEVFKVLAHKYIPITQWCYMDYLDLINDSEIIEHTDYTNRNFKTKTKYNGLVNVFGKKYLEIIQNTIPFIVGSGAIGCELVKNLGMMGIKEIYLTDPDHIEKSNLSRQFLFNDGDIRQSKSETVSKKIKLMNPDINIKSFNQKMCLETEEIFNKDFHSKINIYLNALDNVDARVYMDSIAIKYSKPLIDSGTMGSKGNVQVVIPYLTESYGSTTDPDEKTGIPICTIKAFPYKYEHTIQWARELFETEFNIIPTLLNKYKNLDEIYKLNDADIKQLLNQLYKYKDFELTTEYFNNLLRTIYKENFIDNIKEIINKYSKNKEGFEDKKLPIYLNNQNLNNEIILFYKYGFELLNQIFNSNVIFNYELNNDQYNYELNNDQYNNFLHDLKIDELNTEQIIDILKPIFNQSNILIKINPIEFEKDDDDLYHVHWIWLSSNLRNFQYSISQIDLWETRKIAGNIIPALITTTSLISGFQILEFIKICKFYTHDKYINNINNLNKDIDIYKNRFVNLNTNYCDGINPSPSKKYILDNDTTISEWTNFKTKLINTEEIIKEIEHVTNLKIEFITLGNKTVYDGDDISINILDINDNILVLLENIPIGIPLILI
jgi:ubiquitin-activating enzyme E1